MKGHARNRGNGKWQLEVDLGATIYGKQRNRKYKTVSAKNEDDAHTKLAQFIAELTGEGYIEETNIGFVEYVNNYWFPKFAVKEWAETTIEATISCLENRILPAFQFFKLREIKPIHIIDFLDNLQEDGMRLDGKEGKLAKSSIQYYHRVLKSIFKFAVEIGFLKESPMENIKKPRKDHKRPEVYTLEELRHLLFCLEKESDMPHWQIIVKLAITTGMRRSELFGLEFKHIDLEKGIITIKQALTITKRGGIEISRIKKGSKSSDHEVIISISKHLIEPIRKLELQRKKERLAAPKLWRDGKYNLIIAHQDGKAYHPNSLRAWWLKFLKKYDLKYINVHALRHTAATTLINLGVHAKIISERLGHADITTTMNIYGRSLKEADEVASSKLDNALFGNIETH